MTPATLKKFAEALDWNLTEMLKVADLDTKNDNVTVNTKIIDLEKVLTEALGFLG